MTTRAARARRPDPRQGGGLALATPRRVRVEVDLCPWEGLGDDERARARRPTRTLRLTWHARHDAAGARVAVRSSPLPRDRAPWVVTALLELGLDPRAVRCLDVLCWAHVARVRYAGGNTIAFGLSEAPRDVAHVESVGFPFGRVDGDRVEPWEGCCHGHTDAEVLAAPAFARGRA